MKRIFHPKGTAYGYHTDAFLTAIKANRAPAVAGTCQGNQVEGNCTSGSYGDPANFTGIEPPSCFKADGSSTEIYFRLNASITEAAANQFCTELVGNKTVLQNDSPEPQPYIVKGAGEKKTDLILTVLYDEGACPTDKSNTTLNFPTYTKAACAYNFVVPLGMTCAQDSTWEDYNADYTLMGGVFMDSCALWTVEGVDPENPNLVIPSSLASLSTFVPATDTSSAVMGTSTPVASTTSGSTGTSATPTSKA